MVADKAKKAKLAEKAPDSDHVDVAEKLQEVQDELEKVKEEASDKVLEVEQKYNEKRRPVYLKRNEIIKSIPDFWLTAILSHPVLSDLLSDEDKKIFKYLSSLDAEDFKDVKSGYAIRFNFNKNPYFEDTKLTKTFSFFDDGTAKIAGTTINWKEGMGVANGKGKQKATGRAKVADVIKEDLWPNPPKYFNNEADEDEFEGDEEENGGDDDNFGDRR